MYYYNNNKIALSMRTLLHHTIKICSDEINLYNPGVKVFTIIPEFRILGLTFYVRKSASKAELG